MSYLLLGVREKAFISLLDVIIDKIIILLMKYSFAILASVVLTPLGIYLTTLIITEFIIVVAGIMNLLAIIPSYYIVYKTKDKK